MASKEEIAVLLKIRAEKFKAGLKRAEMSAKKFERTASKSAKTVKKSFKDSFSGIMATAKSSGFLALLSGGALLGFANESLKANRELQIWSKTLGIGTVRLKSFQIALESIGFGGEKATDILKDVNDKLGEFVALGTGQAKDIVERLGLGKEDFKKNDAIGNLKAIVAQMDKLKVSGKERVFLLEALANDASKLEPLLKNNAEELEKLQKAAKDSGRVLSVGLQANLTKLQKSVKQTWDNFKGLAEIGLATLAPLFTVLSEAAGMVARGWKLLIEELVNGLDLLRKGLSSVGSSVAKIIGDARDAREERRRTLGGGTGNFGFSTASLRLNQPTQSQLMVGGALNTLVDMFNFPAETMKTAANKINDAAVSFADSAMDLGSSLVGSQMEQDTTIGRLIASQGQGELQRILGGGLKEQAKNEDFDRIARSIMTEAQKVNRDPTFLTGMLDRLRQIVAVERNILPGLSTAGQEKTIKELENFIRARGDKALEKRAVIEINVKASDVFDTELKKKMQENLKVVLQEEAAQLGT